MSEFYIKVSALSAAETGIKRASGQAKHMNFGSLRGLSGSEYARLKQRIELARESIINEAARMDSLSEALGLIRERYLECEAAALGGFAAGAAFASTTGTDKRSWFTKLLEKLKLKKKGDPALYATADEQEKAMDEYLRGKMFAMLDEKYSFDNWDSATFEERKDMLNDFMHDMEKLMGVNVWGDIRFFSDPPKNGFITNGSYNNAFKNISMNTYWITNASSRRSYDMFTTIAHEMRHAYQHAAVGNPDSFQVSKETLDIWRKNIRNYIYSSSDFDAYRSQPIEADARAFSER